jgi:hypothetical protein
VRFDHAHRLGVKIAQRGPTFLTAAEWHSVGLGLGTVVVIDLNDLFVGSGRGCIYPLRLLSPLYVPHRT